MVRVTDMSTGRRLRRSRRGTGKYKRLYRRNKSAYRRLMSNTVVPTGPILTFNRASQSRVMPPKYKTKLIYEDDVVITASAVVPTSYAFKANGIYDPNVTGTGHQPYLRDQMALFYKHYFVNKAKIFVQWYQPGVVNNALSWMRVFLLDTSTLGGLSSSIYAFRESNLGSPCAPVGHWDFTGMFEKSHCELSYYPKKVSSTGADSDLSADVTTDPTKTFYFVIGMCPPTGADTYGYNHYVRVRIEYDVTFSEPLLVGES